MSDFQLHGLIRGVLAPAFLAGALFLVARLVPVALRTWVRNAGAALGFATSLVLLLGTPHWPLVGSPAGLWMATILAIAWPAVESWHPKHLWVRRYLGLGVVSVVMLWPFVYGQWSAAQGLQVVLAAAGLGSVAWFLLERGSESLEPAATLVGLLILGVGAAGLMFLEGSASFAQLAGALCAVLGAMTVVSLVPALRAGTEALSFVVLVGVGLVLGHTFFVDPHWAHWSVLSGGCLWFLLRSFQRRPAKLGSDLIWAILGSGIPAALALGLAYSNYVKDGSGY